MDTKFSTAIHSLILISESKEPMSSEQIAGSVGTNSSYIRKILGMLKKQELISSRRGVGGFKLEKSPNELTLFDVYKAVNQSQFFDIHQNSSDECIVGKHIKSTLTYVLNDLEDSINKELSNKTLSDCIEFMKNELTPEEIKQL